MSDKDQQDSILSSFDDLDGLSELTDDEVADDGDDSGQDDLDLALDGASDVDLQGAPDSDDSGDAAVGDKKKTDDIDSGPDDDDDMGISAYFGDIEADEPSEPVDIDGAEVDGPSDINDVEEPSEQPEPLQEAADDRIVDDSAEPLDAGEDVPVVPASTPKQATTKSDGKPQKKGLGLGRKAAIALVIAGVAAVAYDFLMSSGEPETPEMVLEDVSAELDAAEVDVPDEWTQTDEGAIREAQLVLDEISGREEPDSIETLDQSGTLESGDFGVENAQQEAQAAGAAEKQEATSGQPDEADKREGTTENGTATKTSQEAPATEVAKAIAPDTGDSKDGDPIEQKMAERDYAQAEAERRRAIAAERRAAELRRSLNRERAERRAQQLEIARLKAEKEQAELLALDKPEILWLYVGAAANCTYCTAAASGIHSGRQFSVVDGDDLLGYTVHIKGNRIELRGDNAKHSYIVR